MIDIKRKYRTRNNLDVELISDKGRGDNPIIGYIGDFQILRDWTIDGKYEGYRDSDCDLVEVKEPKILKCWVNFYECGEVTVHDKKSEADKYAKAALKCRSFTRIGEAVEVTKLVEE